MNSSLRGKTNVEKYTYSSSVLFIDLCSMEHTDINHQGMGLMVSLLDESETMMQITNVIIPN